MKKDHRAPSHDHKSDDINGMTLVVIIIVVLFLVPLLFGCDPKQCLP